MPGFLEINGNKVLLYQKNTLICVKPLNLLLFTWKEDISLSNRVHILRARFFYLPFSRLLRVRWAYSCLHFS